MNPSTMERLRAMASKPCTPEELAEHEAKESQRRHEGMVLQCRLPKRLEQVMLAGVLETQAIKAVGEWNQGDKPFLVLAGGPGVGKTVAAAFALVQACGRFRKAHEITRLSQYDAEAWRELRFGVLAIDDMGTEPLDEKGWGVSALLTLLDQRYDAWARTVITTNMSMDAFFKRYGTDGGRFRDRMREAARWVNLSGESMRGAA